MRKYGIGQPVLRFEDARLLRGQGRYIADVNLPGQAHAVFVRSPHAHALIKSIDVEVARGAPGVLAVYSGRDVVADGLGMPKANMPRKRPDGSPMFAPQRPPLVTDRVRYVGDLVAMVVADTLAKAKDAAELVEIDYEVLPSVTLTEDTVKLGAPAVWDECLDNISNNVELVNKAATNDAIKAAAKVIKRRYVISRVHAQYMEPRGALGDIMEADEQDVEFADGIFKVAGTDKTVTLKQVAMEAFNPTRWPKIGFEGGLYENATFLGEKDTFPNGCHICEVEIDPATGEVKLDRCAVVDDVGTVINPTGLKGQIHGGVAQGVGQILSEQVVWDRESGQLLTASFLDYTMPCADTMCGVKIKSNPVPTKYNPLGAKGAGEAGTVGAMAAVMNAVIDGEVRREGGIGFVRFARKRRGSERMSFVSACLSNHAHTPSTSPRLGRHPTRFWESDAPPNLTHQEARMRFSHRSFIRGAAVLTNIAARLSQRAASSRGAGKDTGGRPRRRGNR